VERYLVGVANMTKHITAAVIGLGPAGLVALKNLKEEGFEVTGFEKNNYIGGLWKYSEGDDTSVLQTTFVNISKERVRFLVLYSRLQILTLSQACFSDFPYPDCQYKLGDRNSSLR
jgi:dimethylaniline monooxygenase (N-oxide forming)